MVQDERKINLLAFVSLIVGVSCFCFETKVWAQNISGTISRIGDATHVEFKGRKEWLYESIKKNDTKVVITVPPLDEATATQLSSWTCPFINAIKINKNAPDGNYELEFSLASADVENFDYLTDDPSTLIFDFYSKRDHAPAKAVTPVAENKKTNANGKNKEKKIAKMPEKHLNQDDNYKLKERRPAGDELLQVEKVAKQQGDARRAEGGESPVDIRYQRGIFDSSDPNYDRFRIKDYEVSETAILASEKNIYIKFPMLYQKLNGFEELMKNPPLYEIKAEDTDENREARLILTLFNKNRLGALQETLKYFYKKRPNSKYNEVIKNIEAEAYIRLYERDHDPKDYETFMSLYEYIVATYPDSVLTERNELLLGYASLKYNDGARALQNLEKFALKYPNSEQKNNVKLSIAEAYVLLNKPDDAIKTYEEIIKHASDKFFAIEASYRIGDVNFGQKKYSTALDNYKSAQNKFSAYKNTYANAAYNIAEAQFWLHKYGPSLESYIEFLKSFPSHRYGGFALTRIGELLEIMGADQQKVMGAYTEGYYRYPESQGSEVSRIRMLSQDLKNIKEREKKYAINEIDSIAKKSTLPEMQEFATLMKAGGLSRRGEYKDSLGLLVGYYQSNPTTANLMVFKNRILWDISNILKSQTENKQYIDALNFYGKYSTTWLKNSDRIDASYYQAFAFEKAGVIDEAEKTYRIIKEKLKSMAGKQEEKERKVHEYLPTMDRINLRLAAIALEQKKYQDAFKYLREIKGKFSAADDVEKIRIGAVVSERMGDVDRAILYLENLITEYGENKDLLVGPRLDIARLYIAKKKLVEADKHLSVVENVRQQATEFSDEDWLSALQLRAELQLLQGQKLAAVETLLHALDAYESKFQLSSMRYKAGKILFDEGDKAGAQKIWSSFSDKAGLVYKKLAAEKVSHAEWTDTYKKYIDRIPAAEKLK